MCRFVSSPPTTVSNRCSIGIRANASSTVCLPLGRDDPEPAPFVFQLHEDLVHPGAADELVVQRLVVRPINRDELVDTVGRKGLHLRLEPGAADRGHQLLVGNLDAENLSGGVSHRGENDRAGIDDGAVEIEEDDRKTHDVMLAACSQYSTRSR